ncbi:TetR/AcrR family transcriptional regulator [Specibacter cremeus]|uniref:TetR/AcrR family transcriptional regulator n=1 Tax=Specibacter cremeus TaxID=1629051 RepID=UPI000F7A5E4D|nr:TetR/AcrR family transcriptional regulator C-terminal domain-containing protein [Specibacter cremeus]
MARPLTPKLSPARIAKAALELVDAHGEFTVPDLAKRLKVSPSSLYNHVDGKADIIELMRGQAVGAIALPDHSAGLDWAPVIREIAVQYRNSYARHPRLIPLLTAYSVRDETTIRMYNVLADQFVAAGFGPARVLEAITVLDNFVLGSALDVAAPEEVWEPGEAATDSLRAALAAGLGRERRADEAFEFGLDLIVAGLERAAAAGP